MYHDMSDDYKSRDYRVVITLQEGDYYGHIYYEYNYNGFGLNYDIIVDISSYIESLTCEEIDDLNAEDLINCDCGLKADINGKHIHLILRNTQGDTIRKTICDGTLENYVTEIKMESCRGHGKKKETRKCQSCKNFTPKETGAKGYCSVRREDIQRSRLICGFDFIPKSELV